MFTLVTHSLTDSLTDCCLVNLIDVTLVCEDANSKLVEADTVAYVNVEGIPHICHFFYMSKIFGE